MCTTNKNGKKSSKIRKRVLGENGMTESQDYYQLHQDNVDSERSKDNVEGRTLEKLVYVAATLGILVLTLVVSSQQWAMPFLFAVLSPLIIGIRMIFYWKLKWQYFMIDFCYFANALTYVFLWFPEHENLYRAVFAVANGPVLVAAAVYRNSLVFHHHDKLTSCYIHFMPPLLTFCARWFPAQTSLFWCRTFAAEVPPFSPVWMYAVPFVFFLLHSVTYFLIVNVFVKPEDPYVTSYAYLAVKYERLNCIGGKWGQALAYYSLNWLFCLCSLPVAILAYTSFPAHCALIVFAFLVVVWNGATYYMHVFNVKGLENDL
ncbi:uncharacterized protein LOC128212401 [Mya arenaria]|uniref:uncharacterized protein LOC128212401 n=1 Tax=Mya arenaria TaxID=6604 RepID=UPI0022E35A55|nr:uncharacterized protein LOC128212401 [Mya arenaria]XP_052773800.1 uncharacterized protein LOC128212401 [Mya arenaria]XP_052773801.1 uncharacterized protein LOC128212401 [Mya arenaria]XP_052773802.1 uncharacterized protein LOC128212401 [Mya arenaria]XP_052773804.1 uncharacterized protein LOC128212401 [Mya arenaria]XP_052773805.1 uncharacterized protein LOC128212401 [Mya arenaria]XP_052773806.1 uncharacterized protein LOC128212401 [Mya arenaria]XP_052773807.1 uncharacterized protein LOC1282